jgi:hypothetical protein
MLGLLQLAEESKRNVLFPTAYRSSPINAITKTQNEETLAW